MPAPHGGGEPSTCDRCRLDDSRSRHLPLPDGVAQVLRAIGDDGPNSPDGGRARVQALVVVDAVERGEPWFALRALSNLDEQDPRWRRLADAVRLFAAMTIACRLAVSGQVAAAVRVVERVVARLRERGAG